MFELGFSPATHEAVRFFVATLSELALLFLGISFFVSFINQTLPTEKVKQLLSGSRGYGVAVMLGSATPFCSCSTLPMTIGLINARAEFGPVMAFLFTSPLLNPYIVGLFWVSFGAKPTIVYAVFVLTLAIFSGYLLQKLKFDRFVRDELLTPACSKSEDNSPQPTGTLATNSGSTVAGFLGKFHWSSLIIDTFKQFRSFIPYMIIGVAIGAILHSYVPTMFFEELAKVSTLWLVPTTAFIGVFLYIRASTMVPIASSLLAKGMSMGAVMSLTIAGAGASLPEMIMMKKMFHWPLLLAFIFLVFSTACITGFAIELL